MRMEPTGAWDAFSDVDARVGIAVGAAVGAAVGDVATIEVVAPAAPQPPTASVTATSRALRHRLIVVGPPFLRTTDSVDRRTHRRA
jgi:hypothetical protein